MDTNEQGGRMLQVDETTRAGRMLAAGRVTATFRSPSGQHITLTAKCRGKVNDRWTNVGLDDATVIFFEVPNQGAWADKVGKLTRRGFTPERNADPARIFCASALVKYVTGKPLPTGLEVFEEDRCGVCGRALTDPVSIERGIGPECYGRMTGSTHQTKERGNGSGGGSAESTDAPGFDSQPAESMPSPEAAPAAEPTNPELDAAVLRGLGTKRVDRDGSGVKISFPFSYDDLAAVKHTVTGRKFNSTGKFWTAPITTSLLDLEAHGFKIEPSLKRELELQLEAREINRSASSALTGDLQIEGLGGTLMPFQLAGVEYALREKRVIIGDEMGLGKTPQALATLLAANAFPAVVVVPNLVKVNWARETARWLPGKTITILDGKAPRALPLKDAQGVEGWHATNNLDADVIIVNYDMLSRWVVKEGRGRDAVYAPKAGSPLAQILRREVKAVVLDESHYIKNRGARRTAACKLLAERSTDLRLLLTGTPILNRPVEWVEQLDAIDRLAEFGGFWNFAQSYCAPVQNRYGWDFSGSSNLPELNEKLREICYVRRDKRDVLPELPPIQRQRIEVEITNRREYDAAANDIISWLRATEGAEAAANASRAEVLVAMNKLRVLAGKGKREAIAEWVEDFLATDEKLILFTWHVEVQDALLEAFDGAAAIRGEDDATTRQAAVDRFQTDPDCKLIVCSLNAGGVGITLTAASHVAFCELPWRPGDVDQAEARAYGRLNDAHGVNSYYLLAERTIDVDMAELLDAKRAVVDQAISGTEGASGPGILEDLMARLIGG